MILLILVILIVVFFYLMERKKKYDFQDFWKEEEPYISVDKKYNYNRVQKQNEIDRILDKISNKGYDSLTRKEKDYLNEYSKKK